MPTDLYGGLHEEEFRNRAKHAVMAWWNERNPDRKVYENDIFIVWQVKAIQNSKALLGLSLDDDGLYFEATYSGDKGLVYLDVYRKIDHEVF